jgi:hypothetical protein
MRRVTRNLSVALVAMVALTAVPRAGADCVSVATDVPRSFREAALVFAGTVVDSNADRLTMRPDRVWKGRPSAPVTIHLRERPSLESYRFKTGERLLVFAQIVQSGNDPDDLPAGVLAMPRGCASPPWPLTLSSQLDEIARPRVMKR